MRRNIFRLAAVLFLAMTLHGENLWPVPPFSLDGKSTKLPPRAAIEPRRRYILEFNAKSSGANTLESSPVLDTLLRVRFPQMTPVGMSRAHLIISDADNKNCIPPYMDRLIYIHSSDWRPFRWEFYAPDTARFLNIRFESADGLEVKDISLRKAAGTGLLNINPDLKMNEYHFPGYGNLYKTIVREDGSLDISRGWTVCDPIPAEPGDRLKLTVEGEAPGGRLLIRTNFYRDPPTDKHFISRNKTAIAITGARKNIEYIVLAPPDTRWLRLSFSSGIIYSVKLEKIKE